MIRRFRRSQLGGLAKDSGYVALWQASAAGALLAQTALITHAFGLSGYGRFAVVVAFVELVGGLFNLRVGIAATTFGARWLVRDVRVAAGVFQYGFLVDMATTVAAVLVLAVLAFTVGPHVAGGDSATLIVVYAFALVGPMLTRSSYVILRLLDRFGLIATYSWSLELVRVVLIVGAIQSLRRPHGGGHRRRDRHPRRRSRQRDGAPPASSGPGTGCRSPAPTSARSSALSAGRC